VRVVRAVLEGVSPGDLGPLARKIAAHPDTVAILAAIGDRLHLCVARSEGVELDAAAVLGALCAELGGKGGGRPAFAQGSAPSADRAHVEAVLQRYPQP